MKRYRHDTELLYEGLAAEPGRVLYQLDSFVNPDRPDLIPSSGKIAFRQFREMAR